MFLDLSIYTPTYISLSWALILILSSRSNHARSMLGIFMLVVAMVFMSHVVYFQHHKNVCIYFDLLFVFGSLSIFPAYYLYIKLLTYKSRIDRNELKHFFPAIAMLVAVSITYLSMSDGQKELYINNYLYGIGKFKDAPLIIQVQLALGYLLQILYFIQIVLSYIKIRQFVANYNVRIANFYSNLENKTLEWPKMILYSFVVSSGFTLITNFMGRAFFDKSPLYLSVACLAYSVILFVLGFMGYMQNHTVKNIEDDTYIEPECETETDIETNFQPNSEHSPQPISQSENISRSKLKKQLQQLFDEEQIYKNTDLKISDIACKLNSNRTYLSNLINSEYGCSFSTYVNRHRIKAAKTLLDDKKNQNLALDHVATLAGFGSLHSFIRAFKEIENTTPGKYRDSSMTTENDNLITN